MFLGKKVFNKIVPIWRLRYNQNINEQHCSRMSDVLPKRVIVVCYNNSSSSINICNFNQTLSCFCLLLMILTHQTKVFTKKATDCFRICCGLTIFPLAANVFDTVAKQKNPTNVFNGTALIMLWLYCSKYMYGFLYFITNLHCNDATFKMKIMGQSGKTFFPFEKGIFIKLMYCCFHHQY